MNDDNSFFSNKNSSQYDSHPFSNNVEKIHLEQVDPKFDPNIGQNQSPQLKTESMSKSNFDSIQMTPNVFNDTTTSPSRYQPHRNIKPTVDKYHLHNLRRNKSFSFINQTDMVQQPPIFTKFRVPNWSGSSPNVNEQQENQNQKQEQELEQDYQHQNEHRNQHIFSHHHLKQRPKYLIQQRQQRRQQYIHHQKQEFLLQQQQFLQQQENINQYQKEQQEQQQEHQQEQHIDQAILPNFEQHTPRNSYRTPPKPKNPQHVRVVSPHLVKQFFKPRSHHTRNRSYSLTYPHPLSNSISADSDSDLDLDDYLISQSSKSDLSQSQSQSYQADKLLNNHDTKSNHILKSSSISDSSILLTKKETSSSTEFSNNLFNPKKHSPLSMTLSGMPLEILDKLKSFPLFANASESFLFAVAGALRPKLVQAQDPIITEGSEARSMYWIIRGTVLVTSRDGESLYSILNPGSFFGEIGILFKCPRTATVVAQSKCLLVVLTSEALNKILPSYPHIEDLIRNEAQERLELLQKYKRNVEQQRKKGSLFDSSKTDDENFSEKNNENPDQEQSNNLEYAENKKSENDADYSAESNYTIPQPITAPPDIKFKFISQNGLKVPSSLLHVSATIGQPPPASPSTSSSSAPPSSSTTPEEHTLVQTEESGSVSLRLKEVPLFSSVSSELLHFLALRVEPRSYMPFSYIIRQNTRSDGEMFFITQGIVEVIDETLQVTKTRLSKGAYFGEVALLNLSAKRTASIRTVTHTECLVLTRAAYDAVASAHPNLSREIEDTGRIRLETSNNNSSEKKIVKNLNEHSNLQDVYLKQKEVQIKIVDKENNKAPNSQTDDSFSKTHNEVQQHNLNNESIKFANKNGLQHENIIKNPNHTVFRSPFGSGISTESKKTNSDILLSEDNNNNIKSDNISFEKNYNKDFRDGKTYSKNDRSASPKIGPLEQDDEESDIKMSSPNFDNLTPVYIVKPADPDPFAQLSIKNSLKSATFKQDSGVSRTSSSISGSNTNISDAGNHLKAALMNKRLPDFPTDTSQSRADQYVRTHTPPCSNGHGEDKFNSFPVDSLHNNYNFQEMPLFSSTGLMHKKRNSNSRAADKNLSNISISSLVSCSTTDRGSPTKRPKQLSSYLFGYQNTARDSISSEESNPCTLTTSSSASSPDRLYGYYSNRVQGDDEEDDHQALATTLLMENYYGLGPANYRIQRKKGSTSAFPPLEDIITSGSSSRRHSEGKESVYSSLSSGSNTTTGTNCSFSSTASVRGSISAPSNIPPDLSANTHIDMTNSLTLHNSIADQNIKAFKNEGSMDTLENSNHLPENEARSKIELDLIHQKKFIAQEMKHKAENSNMIISSIKMEPELNRSIAQVKAKEYECVFDLLSDAILVEIFLYCTIFDQMRLQYVCRRFWNILRTNPDITRIIDLSRENVNVFDEAIPSIVDFLNSRKNVEVLSISNCFHLTDTGFNMLVNSAVSPWTKVLKMESVWNISPVALVDIAQPALGISLEEIDLSNCRKLSDVSFIRIIGWYTNIMPANMSDDMLAEYIETCYKYNKDSHNLVANMHAQFNLIEQAYDNTNTCMPQQQQFVNSANSQYYYVGCRELKRLHLQYCKQITDSSMCHIAIHASNRLEMVDFTRCTAITDLGFAHWSMYSFPNLKKLILSDCSFLTDNAIVAITGAAKNLEYLDLSFCCALSDVSVEVLSLGCPSLRWLNLAFCGCAVSDGSLRLVGLHLSYLEFLGVRGCIRVTSAGINCILMELGPLMLTKLDVSECKNVSGWDKELSEQSRVQIIL